VIDGVEGKPYDRVYFRGSGRGDTVLFSPDGRRSAYVVSRGGHQMPLSRPKNGSAFVISADGHLLTCSHVLDDAAIITVILSGKSYRGVVLHSDPKLDVALLKIDAADLKALPFEDAAAVELGIDVRAIGFPLSGNLTATRGTVSGLVVRDDRRLFQVDAAINPGNSGGPLVNESGEVIGVVNAKLAGVQISNVGFAIPVDQVRDLIQRQDVAVTQGGGQALLSGSALVKSVSPSVAWVSVTTLRDLFDSAPRGSPFVVLDGVEDDPVEIGGVPAPQFSPAGQLVYKFHTRENRRLVERVVIDGQPGPSFNRIDSDWNSLRFSPQGKHIAYVGQGDFGKYVAVLDGVSGPSYNAIRALSFSPDGRRFAYIGLSRWDKNGTQWVAVVDGVPGKPYDNIDPQSVVFSADGKRLAYGAQLGNKQFLVVDGNPGKAFDLPFDIPRPLPRAVFSPDGKRIGYRLQFRAASERVRVVIDDQEGVEFEHDGSLAPTGGIPLGTPVFSPDSQHVAYLTRNARIMTVIHDSHPVGSYFDAAYLTFSPDSQHLAFVACVLGGQRLAYSVVRDGKADTSYPAIVPDEPGRPPRLVFSPDSQHLAYCVLKRIESVRPREERNCIVVDNVESPEFNQWPIGPVIFDGPKSLHTLVGNKRVELELTEE
jgi:WD40 repeat protein